MSETNTVQFVQDGLTKVLGTKTVFRSGSYTNNYNSVTPEMRRHLAVTTALELIQADVSGSHDNKTTSLLSGHLESLSSYADLIQQALELPKK